MQSHNLAKMQSSAEVLYMGVVPYFIFSVFGNNLRRMLLKSATSFLFVARELLKYRERWWSELPKKSPWQSYIYGWWCIISSRSPPTLTPPPSCSQIENGKLGPLSLSFFCILCAFFPLFISLLPCVSLALFSRAASSSSSSSFRVTAIHLTSSRHFLSWLPQRERDQVCVCVCVACTQADKTPGRTPLGTTRGGRGWWRCVLCVCPGVVCVCVCENLCRHSCSP